jgi:hypothetical protein
MSVYLCTSCAIYCKCEIPNECDFKPEVCLAQLDKTYYEPDWHKEEEL